MRLFHQIKNRWQSAGLAVRAGASGEAIEAFERRHGVRLPADMRDFYSLMDGIEYGCTDETLICFWPLAEVNAVEAKLFGQRGIPDYSRLLHSFPSRDNFFVFADYLVWSHMYAVAIADDSEVAGPVIWLDGNWAWIADSFSEFMQRYSENATSILFPDPVVRDA
jgi:hypothetical protein